VLPKENILQSANTSFSSVFSRKDHDSAIEFVAGHLEEATVLPADPSTLNEQGDKTKPKTGGVASTNGTGYVESPQETGAYNPPPILDDVQPWRNDESKVSMGFIKLLSPAEKSSPAALDSSLLQASSMEGEVVETSNEYYGFMSTENVSHCASVTNDGVPTDARERSDALFDHILEEIRLKRKYRLDRNDLDSVLDNAELHWQAELSRCGINDAEQFFIILRKEARRVDALREESKLNGATAMPTYYHQPSEYESSTIYNCNVLE